MASSLIHWMETTLFHDKLESDDRPVAFEFTVQEETYGLVLPSLTFWCQVVACFATQLMLAFTASIFIYTFILAPSRKHPTKHISSNGTSTKTPAIPIRTNGTGYLVGYGLVLPLCLFFPFGIYQALDIRNLLIRFAFVSVPITTMFRCFEAMYGYTPPTAQTSLLTFFKYAAFPLEVKINPQTNTLVPVTWSNVGSTLNCFAFSIGLMSVLLSAVCLPYGYKPLDVAEEDGLLGWRHVCNNLLAAILIQHYLTTFTPGVTLLANIVTGAQIHENMLNPLFEASSPSDFWGRRWNMTVHNLLKRGVYKPLRSHAFSPAVAVLGSFLASGLFHEWVLYVLYWPSSSSDSPSHTTMVRESNSNSTQYINGNCQTNHTPQRQGYQLAFFLWNATLILAQFALQRSPSTSTFIKVARRMVSMWTTLVPQSVVTLTVVMLALPVGHWFTQDYVDGGYFCHGQMAFPLVVKV